MLCCSVWWPLRSLRRAPAKVTSPLDVECQQRDFGSGAQAIRESVAPDGGLELPAGSDSRRTYRFGRWSQMRRRRTLVWLEAETFLGCDGGRISKSTINYRIMKGTCVFFF